MDFGEAKSPLSGGSTEPQLVLLGQAAAGGESRDKRHLLVSHVKDAAGGGLQVGGVTHIDTEDSLMLPMISS